MRGDTIGSHAEPLQTKLMLLHLFKIKRVDETLRVSPRGVFIFLMQEWRIGRTLCHYSPTIKNRELPLRKKRIVSVRLTSLWELIGFLPPFSKWKKRINHIWIKQEKRGRSAWIWHIAVYGWFLSHRVPMAPDPLPLFIMCFVPWCSFPEGIFWWFEEYWGLLWS